MSDLSGVGQMAKLAVFCSLSLFTSLINAAEFLPLGDLPGGDFSSAASDVSDDGSVVVGFSEDADEDVEAFRWTEGSGMVALGELPGGFHRSRAWGVSANGSTVAGWASIEGPSGEAFRWTAADGLVGIGDFSDDHTDSFAEDISADGESIVGRGTSANGFEAFLWSQTDGFTGLGDLPGGRFWSHALAVSADGKIVVGWSESAGVDVIQAFRWTSETGMVGLGMLSGGNAYSSANDVSDDGNVVVGAGESALFREAFRWTEDEGMTGLGAFPDGDPQRSEALGVSGDGQVVVGNSRTALTTEAFIWTQQSGMLRLQDVLVNQGAQGLDGWEHLRDPRISSNGQWIVGRGRNPSGDFEAFLAEIDRESLTGFSINAGHADAWYNPATNGQGFLITVFPNIQQVFLAWFTYDTERPPEDVTATVGEPGHRWLTAQGPYSGDTATLSIYITEGGVFDATNPPAANDGIADGSLTIEFPDCSEGLITYELTSPSVSGEIPIQRIVNDNVALCETLSSQ